MPCSGTEEAKILLFIDALRVIPTSSVIADVQIRLVFVQNVGNKSVGRDTKHCQEMF
ncbi:hypothetical protein DPMN_054297 [Dreissena polymorpha]|uniref:Uncharacterized protein n=1 Tax=Dreissena polymorpha TaxID=45954 RepID=A0A9D4CMW4_DREPO|nr:hypothetical protein DPMN_054297 [Dreissena polymorpha]